MKPTKTKAQIRAEIDAQVNQYLAAGGEVNQIASGISGNTDNTNLFTTSATFEPKQERTPVTDVIKQVEERRKHKPAPPLKRAGRPRKKLITDDFGEPIRWVWVDQ